MKQAPARAAMRIRNLLDLLQQRDTRVVVCVASRQDDEGRQQPLPTIRARITGAPRTPFARGAS